MKKNVGRLDQMLRLGISIILIYIGFIDKEIINDSLSSNILGGIGIINLLIAMMRYCPLYVFAGINTYHKQEK